MYSCPFREEQTASFKVDYSRNLWHDFGTGEGGSIVDLVMRMEQCSAYQAACKLEQFDNSMSILQATNQSVKPYSNQSADQTLHQLYNQPTTPMPPARVITDIRRIEHPKLVAYVKQRGLDPHLADCYLREIHYRQGENSYFSIGFRNNEGGYELSSPSGFKSAVSPKSITTVRGEVSYSGISVCSVFEGFWDFLSYLMLHKTERPKDDIAVLNSVANVGKAMTFISSHTHVFTYLDNDEAGRKATAFIQANLDSNQDLFNRSEVYTDYKDLNDYLCGKVIKQQEKIVKKPRMKLR
jgi:DNA primase